jgi:aryl-alcohol dehydrogenase-like predicted oxidoreductase/enamine deaminase RidA (YjgF/YER057c/UK114 family)
MSRGDARAAVGRSLERLRAERLDLLQFHTWTYEDPRWLDALFNLQELVDEGAIGHLALTNFDTAHLRIALESGLRVVSNQVCFSLLDRRAAGDMSQLCLEHGVALLAYGTLAGGFLTERWLDLPEPRYEDLETHSQMKYKRFIDAGCGWEAMQGLLQVVHAVASRYGVSMANVAARYILDQPAVGGIIVGARLGKTEHIRDTLRLFEFSFENADREAMDAALERLAPIPGDCGDEYRRPPFLTATGDLSDHLENLPAPFPVRMEGDRRSSVGTGTPWEELAGYCRARRVGRRILVSGTTATHGERLVGGADAGAQLHFIIDKIEGALRSLGGRLEDVVRTRVYVRESSDWERVARVHGDRFGGIRPANTLVVAEPIGEGYLVEMEAEAVVPED